MNDARILHKQYPTVPFDTLYQMTHRLWREARAMILEQVSPEEWAVLAPKDKATVCVAAIKMMTDGKSVQELLNS